MSAARRACVLLALAVAGCGGKAPPATPPAPAPATSAASASTAAAPAASVSAPAIATTVATPATAASAAAASPLEVAQLTLGTAVNEANEITADGSRFTPADHVLYAGVATRGRTTEATLNARWRYMEGRGQLVSSVSQTIATDGPALTTFTLRNPDLWPEGRYRIEVELDGTPAITRDFEIARP